MHGVPWSLIAFSRGFHLLHGFVRGLASGVAIECGARFVLLVQNAVGDADVNAGIGVFVLRLEHGANLAIAQALFLIDQQSESSRIAVGSYSLVVRDESAPADMHPVWVDLSILDQRQWMPTRVSFGICGVGESGHKR